jgi:hypothetical protein
VSVEGREKVREEGTGKFCSIGNPKTLLSTVAFQEFTSVMVFRLKRFLRSLIQIPKPDLILVTSMMTYWYPGAHLAFSLSERTVPWCPCYSGWSIRKSVQ